MTRRRGINKGRQGRFRAYAIPLAVLAGLMVPALPATAAEEQVLSYSVPEGAETVWIDIEGPEVNLSNTAAEAGYGSSWTDLVLRDTAFGVSAIVPVQTGHLQLRLDSTLRSDADVSLSFAGTGNALIRVDSQRIPLPGGTSPAPSPSPSASAPDGGTATPTVEPSAPSPSDTSVPSADPETPQAGDVTPAAPGPASPSAVAAPGNGNGNNPGVSNPVNPQGTDRSGLPSTGWTPVLLFTALGLLAAGTAFVISTRKKGVHQ